MSQFPTKRGEKMPWVKGNQSYLLTEHSRPVSVDVRLGNPAKESNFQLCEFADAGIMIRDALKRNADKSCSERKILPISEGGSASGSKEPSSESKALDL